MCFHGKCVFRLKTVYPFCAKEDTSIRSEIRVSLVWPHISDMTKASKGA